MIDRSSAAGNGPADLVGPMELAEILWLAARIPAEPHPDSAHGADDAGRTPPDPSVAPEDGQADSGQAGRRTSTRLFSRGGAAGARDAGLHGMGILVPKASSVDDPLGLMRSLRPLGRGRLAGAGELDEEATVDRSVEQLMATPVMRAGRERQLDLALVVDAHRSMLLWHDLVDELRQIVTHSGVFSDTRTWYLHGTDASRGLELRGASGAAHSPFEVLGQARRRLILVVTDTIADGWSGPELGGLLGHWARRNPVAVINVLPERLWKRGAGRSVPMLLRNSTAGASNRSWQTAAPRISVRRRPGPTVPMVEASATTLGALAELVAGSERWHRLACLNFAAQPAARRREAAQVDEPPATSDPSSVLTRFQGSSSTVARRLAGYLAAVPLTMPVMTLVRRAMLPESENSHLAEVVLGSLFEPWHADYGEVLPDDLEFAFLPGVREALLGAQRRQDVAHVQELVRAHVWQYLQNTRASSRRFLATRVVTTDGVDEPGTLRVPAGQIPFAEQSGHAAPEVRDAEVRRPETGHRRAVALVSTIEDRRVFGIGFLLTPTLVLTCGHLVNDRLNAHFYVDGFGRRSSAETLLISSLSDAALLVLRDEMATLAFSDLHIDLSHDRELVGPGTDARIEAYALRPGGEGWRGKVAADPTDSGRLRFFPSPPLDRFDSAAALSGTPVLNDGALLGLVTGRREDGALIVLRASRIIEDPYVRHELIGHGVRLPDGPPRTSTSISAPLCLAVKVDRRDGQHSGDEPIRRVHRALEAAGLSFSDPTFSSNAELVIGLGSGREAVKTLGNILQTLSRLSSLNRILPPGERPGDLTVAVGWMDRALELPHDVSRVEAVHMLEASIPWSRLPLVTRPPQLMRILVSSRVFPLLRSQLDLDEIEQFSTVLDGPTYFAPIPLMVFTGDAAHLGRRLAGEVFGGAARVEERTQEPARPNPPKHIPSVVDAAALIYFVSHATAYNRDSEDLNEESDSMFTRFSATLSRHLDQLVARRSGAEVGFIDRSLRSGINWEREILNAIGTSQVLIALISAPYVRSEWCGREWDAFTRRRVWRRRDGSPMEPGSCIIPVLWTPIPDPHRLPSVIGRRQLFMPRPTSRQELDNLYRNEGLYGLARAEPDAYQVITWRLAQEVQRLVSEYWTEPMIPAESSDLENSFKER